MNCINTFRHVNDCLTSIRQALKIPNHQIWRVIKHLVNKKSINLSLHKVKAHSGDTYNDLADAEATKGLDASPIIINSKSTMIPLWDSIGPIDRDLRKFCHNIIDAITFDSFTTNSKLQPLFTNHSSTNPGCIIMPLPTAVVQKNQRKHLSKIKILPCDDVRSLYISVDLPIKCPVCGHEDDTNCHLGFCSEFIQPLNDILVEIKQLIYQRLSAE